MELWFFIIFTSVGFLTVMIPVVYYFISDIRDSNRRKRATEARIKREIEQQHKVEEARKAQDNANKQH